MPPNPRVKKAFHAMKTIGISEAKVKPVLKSLLKLYDKNWELIEEENYRALADAIFEKEEAEAAEHKKCENNEVRDVPPVQREELLEEETMHEEPERPLKRLRLRYQEGQPSPSANNSSARTSLKRLRRGEEGELPGSRFQNQSQGEANPSSHRDNLRLNGTQTSPIMSRGTSSVAAKASHASILKEPKKEPGGELSPKQKMLGSLALIKPKDEPYTDDMPQFEAPIAVIHPEPSNKGDTSSGNASRRRSETSEPLAIELRGGRNAGEEITNSSNGVATGRELVEVQDRCYSDVDIASSLSGEIKVSINCDPARCRSDFHMPSLESVLKMVELKCLKSYKILDPNFSVKKLMNDVCECFLELGTQHSHELQATTDVAAENDFGARNRTVNSSNGIMNFEIDAGDGQPKVLQLSPPRIGEDSTQAGHIASMGNCGSTPETDQNGLEQTNPLSMEAPGELTPGEIGLFDSLNGFLNSDLGAGEAPPEIPYLASYIDEESTQADDTASMGNFGIAPETDQSGLEQTNSQSLEVVPCESTPHDVRSVDVLDITKGQENVLISLVNEVSSNCPPSFHYIASNVVFQNAFVTFSLARIEDDNSCSTCTGDCLSLSTPCACAHVIGGDFAYTKEGLVKEEFLNECISMNRDPKKDCQFFCKECPLERSKNEDIIEACKGHLMRNFIKECWWKCGCNKQCGNRVVQRGISHKLQVFMTPEGKGWGLRTLEDLPRGAFVCEYVGEVLTNAELFDRVSRSPNGEEHSYPVLLDADWGSEGVLKDEEALCLDATFYGNVARFINHRCFDSNLVEIPIEIETPDHHYYHIAFFTTRKIKAMEELTWDYGIDFDDLEHPVKAFSCHCGSTFCRNMKRPSRSRSRR
ncbi:probable inactive histone-lysine N-methyltransferase SUVR2 [Lycium ferocissimum]|uniref:probable inactive histone-lysine N-methyltransferase SUVR2 n=1 Tax=Lycium ferocissimum TaxID=112874 RepID=UPI0028149ECE|nr:probable inactive histone-lysine N-methyltransferase SUVR2 [Lycium ferocissimum]XP_059297620.1 probable inactive histone-lysine N-methyltransferase SUVR2 [Lycium ferocissimum]